jgi:DNA repair photolyase
MTSLTEFHQANTESFVEVNGVTSGRKFSVRKHTYGVLVPDKEHPLSCVSVSNSSISIDLWIGCALQCSYCHVQGTAEDLADNGKMPFTPIKRTRFTVDEVVDALIVHPFFVADDTVISIGTASTEPFASNEVTESTFQIMDAFVKRGLRNPIWIVTKGGIPRGRKQDLARISGRIKGVMISLCWADNPKSIEPSQNNRFLRCDEAKEAGATIAWYMRPIVPEWSGTLEKVEMMMLWVKYRYGAYIDAIVPGGLRWTEGVENGLVEIHRLSMPNIPRDDNLKDLPDDLWNTVLRLGNQYFPGVPIFRRSSCALTHMLKVASITSVQDIAMNDCAESTCLVRQRRLCGEQSLSKLSIGDVQDVLDSLRMPLRVLSWEPPKLKTEPSLTSCTYAIRQTVSKALAAKGNSTWKP